MKNNLLTLLKYKLINDFKLNKTSKNHDAKSSGDTMKKRLRLYVLVGAIIVFYVWIYFQQFYTQFKPLGLEQYILPIFMVIVSLIVFIYSIRLTENVLFKSKDYEMLSALPIQPKTILSSKLIYILGINYFLSFLIMLPASIMFVAQEGINVTYVILTFILTFFIPVIPIVLGALIAMAIGYIATKFRYTNLVTTAIMIIFLLSFIFVPSMMPDDVMSTVTNEQMDSYIKSYYPAYLFKNALQDMNILSSTIYIVGNILIFIVFVTLIGKLYNYINQKLKEKFKANKFRGKEYKSSSAFSAMLRKELKKVFTTPVYLLNSCFGLFILLGLSIFMFFTNDIGITNMINQLEMLPYRESIIAIILIFTVALSCTTGSSISLEGKKIWIYKTMPVNVNDILISKLSTNLVIGLPVIILSASLLCIKFGFTLGVYLLLLFVPTMFLMASALFGLLMNLKYPVFDFENEVYVVKRSLSSMLSVLVPMIGNIVILTITMLLPINSICAFLALGLLI